MESCITFEERMYDMYKNDYKELRKMIKKTKDKNGFIFIQFHYYELGYDDEWYVECTKALDPIRARREYLLEWINTTGNSPFDPDDIELLIDMARLKEKSGETRKITKYYSYKAYSDYKGKLPVVLSVDVSQGLGRDYSTIVAINPETLEPMGIFKSNNISSTNFKKVIIKIIQKYYPFCVLSIENNSIGRSLINELRETPVGRFLYKERKTRVVDAGVGKFNNKRTQEGWEYGHNVNTISRPLMMSILESLVKYNKTRLAYPELVEEIKFMEFRNGRITHSSATHDDVTMAYIGGLYVIKHGKNMKGRGIYYNIAEDADECVDFEDMDDAVTNANRYILKHNANYYDEDDGDNVFSNLVHELLDEKDTTAGTFFKSERDEYLRSRDRVDNIESFDEMDPLELLNPVLRKRLIGNVGNYKNDINLLNRDDDEDDYHYGEFFSKKKLW